MKTILTIAGSDCSGGAGIQADLKTFSAHGLFGMSVVVSVVSENTKEVISVENISQKVIEDQMDAVFNDIFPEAVKIGMLSNPEVMKSVALKLKQYKPKNIVIDPVMYAKNGFPLMDRKNIEALIENIIPLADLLTPNIPEAEEITKSKIKTKEDMEKAAIEISKMGCKSVLIKGGHLEGDALDILYTNNKFYYFNNKRINTKNTHGTGCTLSSAIASNLALGDDISDAVKKGKDYVTLAIENSLNLGSGNGPTNHFYALYKKAGMI